MVTIPTLGEPPKKGRNTGKWNLPKNGSKSDRIERFIVEYLKDCNATQAAIRAGYSEKNARKAGFNLLHSTKYKDEIARRLNERRTRLSIDSDVVLQEIHRIATSDPKELFNDKGQLLAICDMPEGMRKSISGVDIVTRKRPGSNDAADVEYVSKIRLWDKGKQLELLGKHLKLWTDRVEVDIHADVENLTDSQLAAVAGQLAAAAGFELRSANAGGTPGRKKDR